MCDICAYADEFGSWPTTHKGTHCRDCHRSWAGMREAHCAACHAHFSADSVAVPHRVNRRCLTADEMLATQTKKGEPVFRLSSTPNVEIWRSGRVVDPETVRQLRQGALK